MMIDNKVTVTFFLVTYNQEKYVREAIEGAFSQTYSPLEIVISDDCSKDGTFRIIEKMAAEYKGPHRIVINRNNENLGLIRHSNRITELSSGELIICADGDDISLPHRTARVVEKYLESNREPAVIFSSVNLIDTEGNKIGIRVPPVISQGMSIEEMAVSGALIIGAAKAITRKIVETFGSIKYDKCSDDLVIGFRGALLGGFEYISEPLILYRHEVGMSSSSNLQKQTYEQKVNRQIKSQEVFLAVLSQRMEDSKKIGNVDLLQMIHSKRTEELLRRKVWTGNYPFMKLLSYSIKKRLFGVFLQGLLRERKWRIFIPLRNLPSRISAIPQ
ncbi:MAG: glycosyltransferase [Chlorobium sp.]|nr:MAG: glycosyltransferase [Chlorobium sp.]